MPETEHVEERASATKASEPGASFSTALAVVLVHEGGLVDDPSDPGGITSHGISLRFLRAEGIDVDGDGEIDAADVRALDSAQVADLYRRHFWEAVHGDALQDGVLAAKLLDVAVNVGVARAVRLVQEATGLPQDGVLGPRTLAAMASLEPQALGAAQAAFYRRLVQKPELQKYLRGWLSRAACTLSTPCTLCKNSRKVETDKKA